MPYSGLSFGRLVASLASAGAVVGCAAVAVAISHASVEVQPAPSAAAAATPTIPALLPSSAAASIPRTPSASQSASGSQSARTATSATAVASPTAAHSAAPSTPHAATPVTDGPTSYSGPTLNAGPTLRATPVTHSATPAPSVSAPRPVTGLALPLSYSTGSATRVITVVAASTSSTTATLQAWNKAPGGGWLRYGPAVTAHVGSQGLTTSPSESKSATPIGSFTLTQAFGHDANPGTPLPYRQTNPNDWWISQVGPLYNTFQQCASGCAFSQGDPNEHLFYETPFYDYAVVIDYNTANAGPIRQGAGSAFFLHVTDGTATAGCVAIPMSNLVTIMKWLAPAAHPRILIGLAR